MSTLSNVLLLSLFREKGNGTVHLGNKNMRLDAFEREYEIVDLMAKECYESFYNYHDKGTS